MGNICRSPAAEGILKHMSENNSGIEIEIDSAGTLDYHTGDGADKRMVKHAAGRGYDITSHRARQFDPDTDFNNFDHILVMDHENYADIMKLDVTGEFRHKIKKATHFSRNYKNEEVPDPYYSGSSGFELVLDILEDSCRGLIEELENESGNKK